MDYATHYDHPHNPPNPSCCACYAELEKKARILAQSARSFEEELMKAMRQNLVLQERLAAPKEYGDWLKEARAEGYEQLLADFNVEREKLTADFNESQVALHNRYNRLYTAAYEAKSLLEDFTAWGGDHRARAAMFALQGFFG